MQGEGILLESGTNELEIVEFQVDHKDDNGEINPGYYGVNVAKVKEIIKEAERLTDVPRSHSSISGVINLRGKIIPIVDLPQWLDKNNKDIPTERIIITQFNKVLTGFLVHSVSRIHRVSWERVEPPSGLMNQAEKECVTGLVKFDDRILMMLDFERIVAEINPETGLQANSVRKSKKSKGKTVFIAEDSSFTRKIMIKMLKSAGYRVFSSGNGLDAYNKLIGIAEEALAKDIPLKRYLNLIISDIEMPQMDGLHLTAKLKEHKTLKDVPVVVFSSMVTEENRKKWMSLGAVDYISKPEIDRLVYVVAARAI